MLKELLAKQLAHKVSKGLDVTEDLNRIDFLFFRGRLTEQEYDELLALVPHEEEEEEVVEQPVVDQVIEEQPTIEEVVEEPVIVEGVQGEEIPEVVEEEQPEVIIVQPEVVEQEEEQEERQATSDGRGKEKTRRTEEEA